MELPGGRRRRTGRRRPGRRRRADGHRRLDHGQLLQGDAGGAEPAARSAQGRPRPGQLPHQPLCRRVAGPRPGPGVGLARAARGGGITAADVAAVVDDDTAVVTLSHVAYHSGYLADARGDHRDRPRGRRAGRLGPVPLRRLAPNRARRLGCRLRGGLHLQVRRRRAGCAGASSTSTAGTTTDLDQPIWGWLGRRDSFEMEQDYLPATGIRSMMSGTPAAARASSAVREGAAVIAEAGIGAIRAKAVALTEMVVALTRTNGWCRWASRLGSPAGRGRRGGHVSIARSDARRALRAADRRRGARRFPGAATPSGSACPRCPPRSPRSGTRWTSSAG